MRVVVKGRKTERERERERERAVSMSAGEEKGLWALEPGAGKLSEIYESASSQKTRYRRIAAEFKRVFGHEPEFYVRAPGRVNLIGEHIDYWLVQAGGSAAAGFWLLARGVGC